MQSETKLLQSNFKKTKPKHGKARHLVATQKYF